MMRLFSNPRFLLPLIIFVSVLVIGVRVGDIWDAVYSGKMVSAPPAMADTKSDVAAPTPGSDAPAPTIKTDPLINKPATPPPDEADVSPAEMQLLEQLSQRRAQLDQRSKELDTHESLIKITEQRVDQKIKEMDKLRTQLQTMVNQLNETQTAQAENLVKIYETMKPEEAARIFETLDLPILIGVIQRMKPARTAPIMAKMAPEKAKDLTIALTKQDQLPQVK